MPRATDNFAAAAARTATGQGPAIALHPADEHLFVMVNVTAVSGTTPSATFALEWSNDGTTWATPGTADALAAITSPTHKVLTAQAKGRHARLVWTISGTTPSFTFSATGSTAGPRAFA